MRSITQLAKSFKHCQVRKMGTTRQAVPFSLYIHWPYCESKCTYCNFNKYTQPAHLPDHRLMHAMATEIKYYVRRYQLKNRPLHSIYFGGGTPSLALPSTLSYLLETIDKLVGIPSHIEITMEANPTSVEQTKLQAFRQTGINRLSLGIQSFDDCSLKMMGRDHSGSDGLRAIATAKKSFNNITFDLIFGRPAQSLEAWQHELKMALEFAGDHLSLYQLSLERGTPIFKSVQRGYLPPIPDQDECADMYESAVKLMHESGYKHYEVSSYSRHRQRMSRHNFSYWQGLDYVGIGPGAHGKLTNPVTMQRLRTFGEFHPDQYIALCESEGEGLRQTATISDEQIKDELIMFGLRTRMGVPYRRFKSLTGGQSLDKHIDQEALKMCIDSGFLIQTRKPLSSEDDLVEYIPEKLVSEMDEGGIFPTEEGLARIDSILPLLCTKKS